jgi:hypothetical protein
MVSMASHDIWMIPEREKVAMRIRLPAGLHAWLARASTASRTRDSQETLKPMSMNTIAVLLIANAVKRLDDPVALAEAIDFDTPQGGTVAFNLRLPGAVHGRVVAVAGIVTAATRRRVSAHRVIVSMLMAQREKVEPDPWVKWSTLMAQARAERDRGSAAA